MSSKSCVQLQAGENLPKYFSLPCTAHVIACWFFSIEDISVTCWVKWPSCYCGDLPSLLTWVMYHIRLELKARESLIKWNLPLLASLTSTNYSSWSPGLTGDQQSYHGLENVDSRHSRGRGGETTRFHTVNVAQPVRFSSKLQSGKSGPSFCLLNSKFRLFLNGKVVVFSLL